MCATSCCSLASSGISHGTGSISNLRPACAPSPSSCAEAASDSSSSLFARFLPRCARGRPHGIFTPQRAAARAGPIPSHANLACPSHRQSATAATFRRWPRPQSETQASRPRFAGSPPPASMTLLTRGSRQGGRKMRVCGHPHLLGAAGRQSGGRFIGTRGNAPLDVRPDRTAHLGNKDNNAPQKCSPTLVLRAARMYRP